VNKQLAVRITSLIPIKEASHGRQAVEAIVSDRSTVG
jgi:hypothetical protein